MWQCLLPLLRQRVCVLSVPGVHLPQMWFRVHRGSNRRLQVRFAAGFFVFFFKILRPGGCSLSHSRCTLLSAAAKLLSAAAELLSAAAELLWIGAAAPLNFNVCFRVQWVLVVIIVFLFFFISFCPFVLISPPQPPRGRRQWDRWHSRTLRRGTSCSEEMDSVLTESSLEGKDDSVQPADVFWLGLSVD